MSEHEKMIAALKARLERLSRELSTANQDIDALGYQLSVVERIGAELLGGDDAFGVFEEELAESRRVLEITGFHEREDGTTFLCECSRCVKRERTVERVDGEVSP
jgi:DNA-binding ferritin-like protein (Dps family)